LASSISAANAAAGGATLDLPSGCIYTITAANNSTDGGNGLPVITGTVTIHGHGSTIARSTASGVPQVRIFDVAKGGALHLDSITLSDGVAANGQQGGGAIDNNGTLTVSGSLLTSNANPATSGTSGGAIQNAGALTVTTSSFSGNTAMEGGAIFNQNTATVTQSTFTNNAATVYGGGALLNAYGTLTVTASTFVGNTGPGGGVLDNDTTAIISDSTMTGNTGGDHGGGAIENFGTVRLSTSTISGNSSPSGADRYNYGTSTLIVATSIVAAGTGGGGNCGGGSPITDGGYNLESAATCGFSTANHSQSNAAPQLQALASNGGPTQTMALTPGSPAVDVIPAATSGCTGTSDQRGVSRPQGPACDIGAYELVVTGSDTQPPTVPTGLAATSTAARNVALTWNPSTDNVGVAGYTVYRNGAALGTTAGSTTAYTDTTAAASTTYSYAVDAFDAAGNHSAQSTALSVTTTAPPPVTAHYVQGSAAGTGTKVSSMTFTLAAPVAAGDLLIGWFGQYDAAGQVHVTDSVNGAWTRAPAATSFGSGHGDIALYYVPASAAASNGLTITVSAGAATYLEAAAAEYAGLASSNPLDQMAVAKGAGTSVDSGPTGSVSSGEFEFSAMMTGSGPGTATPTGGLTLRNHLASYGVDDADMTVAATGPQHGTWTLQTSADWYTVTAILHTASGP
jgi:hypothetical protein